MLGELSQDILGASPKYPPINNIDYLTVDTAIYDNYPSDNESLRIQPKLSKLWNHGRDCGVSIIPNQSVQPLGMRNAEENTKEIVAEIVRESKKAMMRGLCGKELASHLRARFSPDHFIAAKEEMEKVAKEQGLLGNVYIDATAFSSAREAEDFLKKSHNRLARDFVIDEKATDYMVMSYLANRFRKNVVSSVDYNQSLFDRYKAHLVDAGVINKDYVMDSKESLRIAFIAPPEKQIIVSDKPVEKKTATKEQVVQEILNRSENTEIIHRLAAEDMNFKNIYPILEFTRKNLVKGKNSDALKEMLRGKYAKVDIDSAAKYIAVVISSKVLPVHIDKLVETNKISKMIGKKLKKLAKEYPFKKKDFEDSPKVERQIGVKAHYHVSGESSGHSKEHEATMISLRQGKEIELIKDDLLKKMSNKEADKILLSAVKAFNEAPAGIKANAPKPVAPKKIYAEKEKVVLPNPSTIFTQTQEFMDFYKGADEMIIDVDAATNTGTIEIEGLDQKSGLDTVL